MADTWEARMAARARARTAAAQDAEEAALVAASTRESEAELAVIRATLLPPLDAAHCAHGCEFGRSLLEGIPWAGGIAFCECCRADYGFIDLWACQGGLSESIEHDKHLCATCGGKVRHWYERNGVRLPEGQA